MLKIVTAATVEPITLEEAKLFLRVDTDADDTLITALISAAREYAEHYTQATFADVVYELALDAFPVGCIDLPNGHIVTVTSIKYTDEAGVEQTLGSSAYALSDYGMVAFVYPVSSWPVAKTIPNAVRIRYSVSAGAVSAAARTAMLELVAHFYESRENAGIVPPCVLRLLDVSKVYR